MWRGIVWKSIGCSMIKTRCSLGCKWKTISRLALLITKWLMVSQCALFQICRCGKLPVSSRACEIKNEGVSCDLLSPSNSIQSFLLRHIVFKKEWHWISFFKEPEMGIQIVNFNWDKKFSAYFCERLKFQMLNVDQVLCFKFKLF